MTTLGSWLKGQGFTVDDDNVPLGRESEWHGVDWILVHHTVSDDDGAESSIASYVRNGGSGTYPPLAQIMLGQSGTVWMCSKERSGQSDPGRASHAGSGSGYGVPVDAMNAYSLGIECQCSGDHKLAEHPTLYATLIELCAALCRRYDLPADHVIGHKEWSSTGKVDPRDDMDKIRADVAASLGQPASGGPYVTAHVYRSKCGFGEPSNGDSASDTVAELQERLNRISLDGGQELPVTGRYDAETDEEVRLWQEQIAHDPPDPPLASFLGPHQFALMFPDSVYTLHDDGDPAIAHAPEPPTEPEEPDMEDDEPLAVYEYGGKPSSRQEAGTSYIDVTLGSWTPPGDGLLLSMLYLHIDHALDSGIETAGMRVRVERTREQDMSGYEDIITTRHLTEPGSRVTTHLWFEHCDDQKLQWQFDRAAQLNSVWLDTRYAKWLWLNDAILDVTLATALGMPMAASSARSGLSGDELAVLLPIVALWVLEAMSTRDSGPIPIRRQITRRQLAAAVAARRAAAA